MLVAHDVPESLTEFSSDIKLLPPDKIMEDGFQAQCIRLLAPQLVGAEHGIILSDIDLIPMRRSYFIDPVANLCDEVFAIYRSDALPGYDELAICFNAATSETWADLIEPVQSIGHAVDAMRRWRDGVDYAGPGSNGWTLDQRILFQMIGRFDQERVRRFTDADLGFRRLDRTDIAGHEETLVQRFIAGGGGYSDYHMLRPMSRFRATNERIARAALNSRPLPPAVLRAASSSIVARAGSAIHKWARGH